MQPLSLNQKLNFARDASRGGESRFEALCEQHGLDSEELSLWLDAYEAGGKLGILATEAPSTNAPEAVMVDALGYLRRGLQGLYPESLFEVDREGNAITVAVWENRWNGGDYLRPVFQVRHVAPATGRKGFWLLYWHRVNNRWWPCRTARRLTDLEQVMAEVRDDPNGCFWT
jgi:hypothetical protein